MTAAQTLDVVYGLVHNMQVVMEGAHCLLVSLVCLCGTMHKSGRWKGIHRRYPRNPWCVVLTFVMKIQAFYVVL